ncbi:5-carboxymethyl-2-hydroxymuconate Delta-isomerase [Verticiella sediminum]|uniref:5-carboxymethyl-2-hydroxymuconate Delta-isomerase n=1 Tax=Verticiella sediminum TaxID=1247510 RepID=A0A556AZN3_9BURK|nr:5-carboxymethyl-2-hydroxymuconate Delta-isomerase [Verticiella sediminum]TSH98397.1 5-carboxymethyl-2-hydroxymuconate Delta-isomerase [Verticiella sediminum]
MPHIWIEYSANLAPSIDLPAVMAEVQAAAVGDGSVFPLAGARTRAVPVQDYRIADGHPDNAFVHVLLRVGHGRSEAERDALGQRVFATLRKAFAPIMAQRPLGLSLQVDEAHPTLNYKHSNYREYLAERAAAR